MLHVWQHVNLLPLLCVLQVHQLKGERSFHIFYQLVRGAGRDKGLKAELRLPNKPNDFTYLSKSGCMVRRGGSMAIWFSSGTGMLPLVGNCLCSVLMRSANSLLLSHPANLYCTGLCLGVHSIDGVVTQQQTLCADSPLCPAVLCCAVVCRAGH